MLSSFEATRATGNFVDASQVSSEHADFPCPMRAQTLAPCPFRAH